MIIVNNGLTRSTYKIIASMSKQMLQSAQNLNKDVEIAPILVEEDGVLGGLTMDKREKLQFTFGYFGLDFEANYRRDEKNGVLIVRTHLGTRPFTAENRQVRINLSHVIQSTNNYRDGRLVVDPKEQIVFRAERRVTEILSPSLLVALLIEILLQNRQLIALGKILTDAAKMPRSASKARLAAAMPVGIVPTKPAPKPS